MKSHSQCDGRFSAKETLNRHVKVHTGERPHKCTYCTKSFIQSTQLRAHLFHHTGEHAYTCTHCGDQFGRKNRLESHIKAVHENPTPVTCDICNKQFRNKTVLKKHIATHNEKKRKPLVKRRCLPNNMALFIFSCCRKQMRGLRQIICIETIVASSSESRPRRNHSRTQMQNMSKEVWRNGCNYAAHEQNAQV